MLEINLDSGGKKSSKEEIMFRKNHFGVHTLKLFFYLPKDFHLSYRKGLELEGSLREKGIFLVFFSWDGVQGTSMDLNYSLIFEDYDEFFLLREEELKVLERFLDENLAPLFPNIRARDFFISRLDVAKDILTDRPFSHYLPILKLLHYPRTHSEYYSDGIYLKNKTLTIALYDKGLSLGLKGRGMMRLEVRLERAEAIRRFDIFQLGDLIDCFSKIESLFHHYAKGLFSKNMKITAGKEDPRLTFIRDKGWPKYKEWAALNSLFDLDADIVFSAIRERNCLSTAYNVKRALRNMEILPGEPLRDRYLELKHKFCDHPYLYEEISNFSYPISGGPPPAA